MALIFTDSFDYFTSLGSKYTNGGVSPNIIDRTGTYARTGVGAYRNVGGPFGPSYSFTGVTTIFVGVAVNPGSFFGIPYNLYDAGTGATNMFRPKINSDGSISVLIGNDPFPTTYGPSAPGVVQLNAYNYLECKIVVGASGSFEVKANGLIVLSRSSINTNPGTGVINTLQLAGPGGGGIFSMDDLYICDNSGAHNNNYLGAVRIYSGVPIADSTPLQWTPDSGVVHWSRVNEIPPDDDASYNADATVGEIDHYIHGFVGVPVGQTILAVQHTLDARIDVAGSRVVASEIGGFVGASLGLTTTYHMVIAPWDINPVTGLTWTLADFATLGIGPKVTA